MSNSGTVNFTGDCGESTSGYFSATCIPAFPDGMAPGQSATVNEQLPQYCVIANDGAKVFSITLQAIAGFYNYQVQVVAQGPSGIGSGSMYLAFKDMTDDVYYLSIFSSRKELHTVSYNSGSPNIQTIYWSDYGFTVSDATTAAKKEKPAYKVESAVESSK